MNAPPATLPSAVAAPTLRAERAEDEAFLFALYASTRESELALTGWGEAARRAFLDLQFRAMRQGYRNAFPQAQFAIILLEGCPVGRAVVERRREAVHLVDLALLPAYQERGLGSALVRGWCAEAAERGQPLRLHVLKGSRARRFYQRLGFSKIGDEGLYECLEWRGVSS